MIESDRRTRAMHQSSPAPAAHASTSSENDALTATVMGNDAVATPAAIAMPGRPGTSSRATAMTSAMVAIPSATDISRSAVSEPPALMISAPIK